MEEAWRQLVMKERKEQAYAALSLFSMLCLAYFAFVIFIKIAKLYHFIVIFIDYLMKYRVYRVQKWLGSLAVLIISSVFSLVFGKKYLLISFINKSLIDEGKVQELQERSRYHWQFNDGYDMMLTYTCRTANPSHPPPTFLL